MTLFHNIKVFKLEHDAEFSTSPHSPQGQVRVDDKFSMLTFGSCNIFVLTPFYPRFSTYNTVDKSSLTIRIVNLEDAGTYECRSWNSNSAGNNTASITVKPAGKFNTRNKAP